MTIVAVCLDGVSWDYLEAADTPFLDSLRRIGSSTRGRAMIPTVTNLNHASILTASYPETHGISGNTYYEPASAKEVYMDEARFLRCPTLLEASTRRGWETLLLTVKDKLRRLLSKGVTHSYSVERPVERVAEELGPPPSIYTAEADLWLLRAARWELERRRWDLVYVSTTDFILHKYGPKENEAKEYIGRLDEALEELWGLGVDLGVVSDHGMREKRVSLDPVRMLEESHIEARLIAVIRDEHYVHHRNLGGAAYLYVEDDVERAKSILAEAEGVEMALRQEEAAERFKLPRDRIGDILLLAEEDYTLGLNPSSIYRDVELRSHGSLHEVEVPLFLSLHKPLGEGVENRLLLPILGFKAGAPQEAYLTPGGC